MMFPVDWRKCNSSWFGGIFGMLFPSCLRRLRLPQPQFWMMYCIGGDESSNSVCWLDLLKAKGKWKSVKTLGQTHFSGQYYRDESVVKNKIVYFGSHYKDKATYVLEQGEKGEWGNIEVRSRFAGIDYTRGAFSNSSFCTYKEKIFFFPVDEYSEVWCLNVEHSSLFFSHWFFLQFSTFISSPSDNLLQSSARTTLKINWIHMNILPILFSRTGSVASSWMIQTSKPIGVLLRCRIKF